MGGIDGLKRLMASETSTQEGLRRRVEALEAQIQQLLKERVQCEARLEADGSVALGDADADAHAALMGEEAEAEDAADERVKVAAPSQVGMAREYAAAEKRPEVASNCRRVGGTTVCQRQAPEARSSEDEEDEAAMADRIRHMMVPDDDQEEATARPLPEGPARLCVVALLERPGGFDALLHSARLQTSRAFRLVALDARHAERATAVAKLASKVGVSVAHEAAPLGSAGWDLAEVWRAAKPHCGEDGELEVVSVVRQAVWLAAGFVEGTLAEIGRDARLSTARGGGEPLLGYPVWQLGAPSQEVDEGKVAAATAAPQVFSPPLQLAYSRRGWQLARRLQPAPAAPLAGAGAAPLSGGLPLGVWSMRPSALAALGRAVPPAALVEAERCWAAGRPRPPKGVKAYLADLSLLCEALDSTDWEPQKTWAADARLDGFVAGC